MESSSTPTGNWEPTEEERQELKKLLSLREDPRALVLKVREVAPKFGRKPSEVIDMVLQMGKGVSEKPEAE